MNRMRACVCVVCARDPSWTPHASPTFTDVRTRVTGIGMARSYTKSEYAQPLVDPKQTLFDTNIESWRYSGAYPWAVLTALQGHLAALCLALGCNEVGLEW